MTKRTWKDRALRTQKYAHLRHHCKLCHKDYKGLNVMRHALSHLKGGKLKCILCGKRFNQLSFARKHVREHKMDKDKPPDKDPGIEGMPATDGKLDNVKTQKKPQDENETPNEKTNQMAENKRKVPPLKRENRIIKNLRTLIKKTSGLHSKCKNPSGNTFKHIDFLDEQVIIKDGLVIVKHPAVEEGEEEGKETPEGDTGNGVDNIYQLCPSESCDKVFLRISNTLTKHAIKYHLKEDNVLEKTFVWSKHKCTVCSR